jgi:hypothetical protein
MTRSISPARSNASPSRVAGGGSRNSTPMSTSLPARAWPRATLPYRQAQTIDGPHAAKKLRKAPMSSSSAMRINLSLRLRRPCHGHRVAPALAIRAGGLSVGRAVPPDWKAGNATAASA